MKGDAAAVGFVHPPLWRPIQARGLSAIADETDVMSHFVGRLSILLVASTTIALALVGWAGGVLTVESLDRSDAAVVVGLSLLVASGLIAVLYEPLETDGTN